MSLINRIIAWGRGDDYYIKKVKEYIRGSEVNSNELIVVGGSNYSKWVHLKCPCGCGEMINISLMKSHKPNWILKTNWGQPTLYPSIWKKDGCKSHFWVRSGKLEWHFDNFNE